MASKQTQVAGLFSNLSFRLQIGQFDAGMEGITACAVALKLHLCHLQGSLVLLRNSRRAYILSILWREPWSLININPVGRLNVHPNSAESETYLSCKIRDCVLVGVLFTLFLRPSWSTCNLNPRPCFQIRVTRKHLAGHVELVVKRENEPLRADDLQRIAWVEIVGDYDRILRIPPT